MIDRRMFIEIASPVMRLEVGQIIPKGAAPVQFHESHLLYFIAPILLKPMDIVWLDLTNRKVEMVARGSIVIWHAAWRN